MPAKRKLVNASGRPQAFVNVKGDYIVAEMGDTVSVDPEDVDRLEDAGFVPPPKKAKKEVD